MKTHTEKDLYYMGIAMATARRSKCDKAQYGAVIVDTDDRIASTGYNGKPAKSKNDWKCLRPLSLPMSEWHQCCLHAEANAIMVCDRTRMKGATLYVTGCPCEACALLVMQSGIRRVVHLDVVNHAYNGTDFFWASFGHNIERVSIPRELVNAGTMERGLFNTAPDLTGFAKWSEAYWKETSKGGHQLAFCLMSAVLFYVNLWACLFHYNESQDLFAAWSALMCPLMVLISWLALINYKESKKSPQDEKLTSAYHNGS